MARLNSLLAHVVTTAYFVYGISTSVLLVHFVPYACFVNRVFFRYNRDVCSSFRHKMYIDSAGDTGSLHD